MHLDQKISASSIAEVVMAVAVIATCIGISALVFARTIRVTTDFESVRMQTELQSRIWKQMVLAETPTTPDAVTLVIDEDPTHDSVEIVTINGNNERLLWTQHWLKYE
jgi:hypothetical protein